MSQTNGHTNGHGNSLEELVAAAKAAIKAKPNTYCETTDTGLRKVYAQGQGLFASGRSPAPAKRTLGGAFLDMIAKAREATKRRHAEQPEPHLPHSHTLVPCGNGQPKPPGSGE